MINFEKKKGKLFLHYMAETNPHDWILKKLEKGHSVKIAKTFSFAEDDLLTTEKEFSKYDLDMDNESLTFVLGNLKGEYYQIKSDLLNTKHDVFISKDLPINKKTFIAPREISIFSRINRLIEEQIIIGGSHENAIPIEDFKNLLKNFPTTTELNHYAGSRISLILKDYLGSVTDAQKKLNDYLKKKKPIKPSTEIPFLYEHEIQKYEFIRGRIKEMLKDSEAYSEDEWQELMLQFILLIFPKYIAVLRNVNIKDHYSKIDKVTDRYIDLALVDVSGNLDVIEIKKPFDDCLLSSATYRDNYTPKKELSGTIMQAEKYLFHLNKWGVIGEKKITEKYKTQLPAGMKVKITNPKAMIILGRSKDFAGEQSFDFEIMKRKYANILDIITYDDLLNRLENIIKKFKKLK